jgi:hypothetical protein
MQLAPVLNPSAQDQFPALMTSGFQDLFAPPFPTDCFPSAPFDKCQWFPDFLDRNAAPQPYLSQRISPNTNNNHYQGLADTSSSVPPQLRSAPPQAYLPSAAAATGIARHNLAVAKPTPRRVYPKPLFVQVDSGKQNGHRHSGKTPQSSSSSTICRSGKSIATKNTPVSSGNSFADTPSSSDPDSIGWEFGDWTNM